VILSDTEWCARALSQPGVHPHGSLARTEKAFRHFFSCPVICCTFRVSEEIFYTVTLKRYTGIFRLYTGIFSGILVFSAVYWYFLWMFRKVALLRYRYRYRYRYSVRRNILHCYFKALPVYWYFHVVYWYFQRYTGIFSGILVFSAVYWYFLWMFRKVALLRYGAGSMHNCT
jgi:hypothetical protein